VDNENNTLRNLRVPLSVILLAALVFLWPARSQAERISLIRDAEIESIIRAYATPLFQAAGLSPTGIKLILINDKSLNAFVADGLNIYINTGLLMRADDPLEVIGVIAHETGHLSGAHIAARGDALAQSQAGIIASYVLGLGAALATGNAGVGAFILTGGQDIALKGLLRYTRSQESAADQAALTLLEATEQSPRGLLEFMERLEGQEVLLGGSQDPYLSTHPLSSDRVDFFRNAVQKSPYRDNPASAEFRRLHERMRAKLIGFLEPLRKVIYAYPESDNSVPARYARAIAYYRIPDLDRALPLIDGLLADYPEDPYFHELKGQILFENARIREALPEYEAAARLLPASATIRQALAQAQIEINEPEFDRAALENLSWTLREEPDNAFAWRLAAIAHGRAGDQAMTALALAESALAGQDYPTALRQARRAEKLLNEGTPGWLRAQDLGIEAERQVKKMKKKK
jgi:predicted Zn-dependent protease